MSREEIFKKYQNEILNFKKDVCDPSDQVDPNEEYMIGLL